MPLYLGFGTAQWGTVQWGSFQYGGGGSFALPDSLVLKGDSWRRRHEEKIRALAHGAVLYGMEFDPRDLVVEGYVLHDDPDEHLQFMLDLKQALHRENLQLRYRDEFFAWVHTVRGDHDWEELTRKTLSRLRIPLRLPNPFWHATAQTVLSFELEDGETIVVDTGAGDWPARVEVWPVLTFTAPNPGQVPSIALRNESDGGWQLTYHDLQLRDGAAVVVNGELATVERGGENTLRFFDGAPLRLKPGENRLKYEGAACTLEVRYRARWI